MADAVTAFRQISWLIFKWLLYAVLIVVLLGLAITGAVLAFQWYTHGRHEARVEFTISLREDGICKSAEHPIFVGAVNRSGKSIAKIAFTLKANVPGRSTDLVRYHSYSDDKVIAPTEGYGICWAVPDLSEKVIDPRKLEWGFRYKTITFKED